MKQKLFVQNGTSPGCGMSSEATARVERAEETLVDKMTASAQGTMAKGTAINIQQD